MTSLRLPGSLLIIFFGFVFFKLLCDFVSNSDGIGSFIVLDIGDGGEFGLVDVDAGRLSVSAFLFV
jgi:hypothetical protein